MPDVVVTGAAGYIGSRLLSELQEHHPDWDLVGIDNFYLGTTDQIGDVAIENIDVRDRDALETALDGADAVAHLAAVSGVDDCEDEPDHAYETNVLGTEHVAWWCRRTGAAMLFPFSMAVLGDPVEFPITVDHPRDPLNWYGRTKYLNEQAIETFADGAFPAVQFMISNLYGAHEIDGTTVSKDTVINFFANRALAGEPLTVYAPGSQARNFIHVTDVAAAMRRGLEWGLNRRADGEAGTWKYEVATNDALSVKRVAELVQAAAAEERDIEVPVKIVDNPREDETLVDRFDVDTTAIHEDLGWEPQRSVADAVRDLVRTNA